MRDAARLLPLLAVMCAALAGCATPPPASDPAALAAFKQTNDPLEPSNRVVYKVNNAVDTAVLKPVAQGYVAVVPHVVRHHIGNVLDNLNEPVVLANDMMQGKPRRAGDSLMRLLINSTAGVGGIFDVARRLGYPNHDTDFGITLALWGVHSGPYLYLPVLGPSGPRDLVGFGADIALDPFTWVGQGAAVADLGYARYGVSAVNTRAQLLKPIDQIKRTALDPYATFRSLYRQHRRAEVKATRADNRATVPDWFPQPRTPQPKTQ